MKRDFCYSLLITLQYCVNVHPSSIICFSGHQIFCYNLLGLEKLKSVVVFGNLYAKTQFNWCIWNLKAEIKQYVSEFRIVLTFFQWSQEQNKREQKIEMNDLEKMTTEKKHERKKTKLKVLFLLFWFNKWLFSVF